MNKQNKYFLLKTGVRLPLKSVRAAVLPFSLALLLILPQSALAQTETPNPEAQGPCSIKQGIVDESKNNSFTEDKNRKDYEITCTGEIEDGIINNSTEFTEESGIDLSERDTGNSTFIVNVTGETDEISISLNAEKVILRGAIANEEESAGGQVVNIEPSGTSFDVDVESEAQISSKGNKRIGLRAWTDPGSANARSVLKLTNSGMITTEGDDAYGIEAGATAGSDTDSEVTVVNSGKITTSGEEATGLSAYLRLNDAATAEAADALGLVSVTNTDTITVTGDGAIGLEAVYRPNESDPVIEVANSGDVKIVNSGRITASGKDAKGIYAETFGTGYIEINVSGTVSAGNRGASETNAEDSDSKKAGIGIHAKANTGILAPDVEDITTLSDSADGGAADVIIVVEGENASIMAYGAPNGDDDQKGQKGIAIKAETDAATGHSHVSILDGARVSAFGGDGESTGYAVMFEGGKGTLDLGNSVNIEGDVINVTELNKVGKGYARLGGNVEFKGTGTALNLEEGALVITGTMDLGSGKVTIHEAGRIVFEIGEKGNLGSITAGSMHFEEIEADNVSVYARLNNSLTPTQGDAARSELTSKEGGYKLLDVDEITSGDSETSVTSLDIVADGLTVSVGNIEYMAGTGTATFTDVSQIPGPTVPQPEPPTTPPASSGDDDNNNAILGLGLVAILVAMFWGDGLFGSSFADDYAFNTPQSAYIASVDETSTLTLRETGNQPYQVWIRTGLNDTMQLAGVKNAGVSGTEIGLSLYRSDDFYIEASSAQNVAAQVNSLNQSAQGEMYSLSSGWQNERYFAGVKLSYGDFDTDTVIDNPVVKSTLISQSEVRHTQAQFTAGTRWNTGNLLFTPSASVQAGTFDYSAHQAQGAVVNADIPSYTQDYSALRLGLKMSASDWLSFSDNVKWKPHLQFDQIHTDSGSGGDVTLRQMDRLGALSFNSGASVQAMPEVVNAVSFGTSVKTSKSSQSEWKFGYAGLEADGEYYHAAVAAYQMRF